MSYSRVIRIPDYLRLERGQGDTAAGKKFNNPFIREGENDLATTRRESEFDGYFHQCKASRNSTPRRARRADVSNEASSSEIGFTCINCTSEDLKSANINRKEFRGRTFSEPTYSTRTTARFASRRNSFWIVLLFGLLMMPGISPSELSDIICSYLDYKNECEMGLAESLKNLPANETFCPGEFDSYMCWPHGLPGQSASAGCPMFSSDDIFNDTSVGHRFCHTNGSWYRKWDKEKGEMAIWRNIAECGEGGSQNDTTADEADSTLLTNFRIMYSIGYGVSLVCLVVALLLLAFFKKLHCTRNYIHMNLMVSFIIRYVVILIKDSVLTSHYELDGLGDVSNNLDHARLQEYCDAFGGAGWVLTRCRLIITLMHYAITANYFWLLAEGLYLQMLLVFAMSEHKYFAGFMVFGWGAPWISVLIWVALRLNYENSGCWDMNDKLHVWWTIRVPIIISIVINFLIFVNIVRLIVSKLQAHNMAHSDYKLRLAKSTLALIPLLGIHYIVFFALTEEVADNTTPMHLKLAFDMFLTSIQGMLVSVLYCFLNGEVRTVVRKAWRDWRTREGLPRGASNLRKGSTIHSGNQTSVTYVSRHSTTGTECLLMNDVKNQSPNSIRFDNESKNYSITPNNQNAESKLTQSDISNGNGIILHSTNNKEDAEYTNRNNKFDERDDQGNATTILMMSPVSNGKKLNGNTDCQDCVPCLREESV